MVRRIDMRCSEHARARSSALCSGCTALIRVPKGNQGRPYKSFLALLRQLLPATFLFRVAFPRRGDATGEAGGPHRPELWAWTQPFLWSIRLCSLLREANYLREGRFGNRARDKPHPRSMGG